MAVATPSSGYAAWVARLVELKKLVGKQPRLRRYRPLALANQVSNRRLDLGEATCITEMSVMMACWKQNEFSDVTCAQEIQAFFNCAAKAEEKQGIDMLKKMYCVQSNLEGEKPPLYSRAIWPCVLMDNSKECMFQAERKGKLQRESLGQSGKLSSKQINKLLKMFPNISHNY